jgi:hypothetical protein
MTVFKKYGEFSTGNIRCAPLGEPHGRDADRISLDQTVGLRYASFVHPDLP